MRQGIKTGYCI